MTVDTEWALGTANTFGLRVVFATIHSVVVAGLTEIFIGTTADKHGDAAAVLALVVDELVPMLLAHAFADAKGFVHAFLAE